MTTNDTSLAGKTALVTGGGHGVGRGIALALSAAGANVAICGRTAGTLASVHDEIVDRGGQCLDVVCDITSATDRNRLMDAVIERYGTIDILINNAAVVPRGSLLEIDDQLIQQAWETGPIASLQLMRACHPYLKDGGAIVNVSSGVAVTGNAPIRGIYAAVKSALNSISRAAANEWGTDGIRVNTIMPVAMTEPFAQFLANNPEGAEGVLAGIPLGRIGDCETDIGRAVVFLVSPEASYITGTILPIDGGASFVR